MLLYDAPVFKNQNCMEMKKRARKTGSFLTLETDVIGIHPDCSRKALKCTNEGFGRDGVIRAAEAIRL